jgi:putative Mn2+ efflux pump MntP
MAVNISKGDHLVEMMPHSLYLKKARWISFPLMALLGIYWIFTAIRRKRK